MAGYQIVNWKKYQGRKHVGLNPWVKVHKSMLGSDHFLDGKDSERLALFGLCVQLLLISDDNTGEINLESKQIAKKLRLKSFDPKVLTPWFIKPLHGNKSVTDVSQIGNKSVLPSYSYSSTKSNSLEWLERFKKSYPVIRNPAALERAWKKIDWAKVTIDEILSAVEVEKKSDQWRSDNGKWIPGATKWIEGQCWAAKRSRMPQAARTPQTYPYGLPGSARWVKECGSLPLDEQVRRYGYNPEEMSEAEQKQLMKLT